MKPKIKIISGGPQQATKKVEPNYQNDPSKSNNFLKILEETQQEINTQDIPFNLEGLNINGILSYQQWAFSFEGAGNFKGKKISGVLHFPTDYPDSAPKFYFDPIGKTKEVIQHVNIYGDNLLCIPLLTHWKSTTNALEILEAIKHIFIEPNWGEGDAPANPGFNAMSAQERDYIQQRQAQQLPDFEKD